MKLCVCGREAERIERYIDPEHTEQFGVIAIVNGQPCCSALESRKYAFMDFDALVVEFNDREHLDLAYEAGCV